MTDQLEGLFPFLSRRAGSARNGSLEISRQRSGRAEGEREIILTLTCVVKFSANLLTTAVNSCQVPSTPSTTA